ncbi:MAG: hypothetical protein ABR973_07360 [Candidatus Acidiferrales bacterium]|jgi:hypothetical protein
MRWLFETKESKGRRHDQEEQGRKREEATRMMADLFIRHNGMATADIIGELEQMHQFYAVASWAPSEERGGYFYQIAMDLSHARLTPEETGRLVAMLLWPELRAYKDRSAPSCFVSAAIQNPSEAYIPTLTEHFAWLEKEIKTLPSTQYRADIASEMRLTKGAIQACRASMG